jgi:hypothetical protein
MNKKCFLCDKPAKYVIKGTNDYYCEACASDHFGDLSFLVSVEEEAKRLKEVVDKQMEVLDQVEEEMKDKLEEKEE